MIDRAIIEQDPELFRKADEYRVQYWENTMRQVHDLVHFSHFAYRDVMRMPYIERVHLHGYTKDRVKEEQEFQVEMLTGKRIRRELGSGK